MAEVIGIVAGVANILAIIDNLYRGIQFVQRATEDPKVDGLFVRLVTEKARYAEWRRRMGIENNDDIEALLPKLPEEAARILPMILSPVNRYTKLSEHLFEKYGIKGPSAENTRKTPRDKLRRANFFIDGQRQLDEVLDTLKSCNDGLFTIAPPAPGYWVSRDDPILETSGDVEESGFDSLLRRQSLPNTSQSPSAPSADPLAVLPPPRNRAFQDPREPKQKVYRPMIELLHSTCLGALRAIERQYSAQSATFQVIGDQLSLWGSGLFHGQVSIDQVLGQDSPAINILRTNVAGILADMAIILRQYLSVLGEPDSSPSILCLREVFSIQEISILPSNGALADAFGDTLADGVRPEYWLEEITDLVKCLLSTLSPIELSMKETLARQRGNPAMDEGDLVLLKSDSNNSLPSLHPASAKSLLSIDLQLVAAMQASLKESKFAKYMEHKDPKFDAAQILKDLENESRQMRYWTSQIGGNGEDKNMTAETQEAMILNLARIARTCNSEFIPRENRELFQSTIKDILDQCSKDYPDLGADLKLPLTESDTVKSLDVLRSSNTELRRLAGAKSPGKQYSKDFALQGKAKLAAEERAQNSSVMI